MLEVQGEKETMEGQVNVEISNSKAMFRPFIFCLSGGKEPIMGHRRRTINGQTKGIGSMGKLWQGNHEGKRY